MRAAVLASAMKPEKHAGCKSRLPDQRRGWSHEFASLAIDRVRVPMLSRRINCLNHLPSAAGTAG